MRVLAATFQTQAAGKAAQARLREAVPGDPHAVRLGDLGRAGDPSGPATILAGRFDEQVVRIAREVVESFGGTIVVDIDQARTQD
jgi:hypothetical protein